MIREQQRQVSKVLLDGLYDPDSPISKLLGVRTEVMGEIIWQKLVQNWQIFPGDRQRDFHLKTHCQDKVRTQSRSWIKVKVAKWCFKK